jgi:hypothetical protein
MGGQAWACLEQIKSQEYALLKNMTFINLCFHLTALTTAISMIVTSSGFMSITLFLSATFLISRFCSIDDFRKTSYESQGE